jgi:hypothetical protein
VRKLEPLGDARRDRDRPIDSRRDEAVDAFGVREPLDTDLVFCRDDRAPVGEAKARRPRVAVGGDDEMAAGAGGGEQTELGGTRP